MLDVFVSYSRRDRDTARQIATALQNSGKTVWWDHELIGGTRYRDEIRTKIKEARKTIVLWSPSSVTSAFVIDEASEAKRLGRLIPVMIEACEQPFGFGDLHVIDLTTRSIDVEPLLAAIDNRAAGPSRAAAPSRRLLLAGAAAATAGLAGAGAYRYWPRGTDDPAPGRRTALLIGNSKYRTLMPLENPARDVQLLGEVLSKAGFSTAVNLDLEQAAMRDAVTAFESTLSYTGGVGLFYYAGSAAFIDGEDIMFPVDAKIEAPSNRIVGGLNLTRLQSELRSRTTQHFADHGVATMYAASKGEQANDGPIGGNSPFCSALARAIGRTDDELSAVFRHVQSDVKQWKSDKSPGWRQTPFIEESRSSSFHFGHPARDPRNALMRIVLFDSCRDDPYKVPVASR